MTDSPVFQTYLGAAHEVTGSCYLLETVGDRLLLDWVSALKGEPDFHRVHREPRVVAILKETKQNGSGMPANIPAKGGPLGF